MPRPEKLVLLLNAVHITLAFIFGFVASTSPSLAASITSIGRLPDASMSTAEDVSRDGSFVVGWSGGGVNFDGAAWTESGGLVPLTGLPPSTSDTRARATADDGEVVVGYSGGHAFIWTNDSGFDLLPGAETGGFAMDVSSDGRFIVGSARTSQGFDSAFQWDRQSEGPIQFLSGTESRAYAVAPNGSSAVGFSGTSVSRRPVVWSENGTSSFLGTDNGIAFGMSDDASVVVGFVGPGSAGSAFRWTAQNGVQPIGFAGTSRAYDTSADGSVIVGLETTPFGQTAMIWSEGAGARSLYSELAGLGVDLSDWSLNQATGISADGRVVVGYGTNLHTGAREGFIATIPEPSTGLLLCIGMATLASYRMKK